MSKAASSNRAATSDRGSELHVMIVDDHPVVREGIARFVEAEPDMQVCCQMGSASEAFSAFCKQQPDIVLVDLTLAEGSGIELIKDLVAHDGAVKILVISGHDENLYAERCLRAGAMGYINKHEAADHIVEAIRSAQAGNLYLSKPLLSKLLRRATGMRRVPNPDDAAQLSDRELEVFELLGRGKTINEIAEHLHLSPKTIETYRAHLKDKLRIETSQQLARRAFQWVESGA